jgi:hypothetical protein
MSPRGRILALVVLAALFLARGDERASRTLLLSWNRNPEPDIAGYKVYSGSSALSVLQLSFTAVTNVGNVTSNRFFVDPGRWHYFAVTAYNEFGLESDLSGAVAVCFVP